MNKISELLESLLPVTFRTSNSTNSVYAESDNLLIRIADHLTMYKDDCDLQIISPINNNEVYLVLIRDSKQVMYFANEEELANFIKTFELINRIENQNKKDRLSKKSLITNSDTRTNPDEWDKVCNYLVEDCPAWSNLTPSQKKECRRLLTSKLDYYKCVKYINSFTSEDEFTTKSLHERVDDILK